MDNVTINGTLLSSLGVELEHGWQEALLAPAPTKGCVTNYDPRKDGVEIITKKSDGTSIIKKAEREVTLTFLIHGENPADFLDKYDYFIGLLQSDEITLYTPELGRYYRLLYRNTTRYENYRLHACKIAIKFTEPNPTNRAK